MGKLLIKNLIPFIIVLAVLSGTAYSMGEPVIKPDNLAYGGKIFSAGDFVSADVLIDGKLDKPAVLSSAAQKRSVIIELKKTDYIEKIKLVFKGERPKYDLALNAGTGVGFSIDFLNWKKPKGKKEEAVAENKDIYEDVFYAGNEAAAYIKLSFPQKEKVELVEVEVYPTINYTLELLNVRFETGATKVTVHFETNFAANAQVVYGYNYDFVYNHRLDKTVMDLGYRKKHKITISKLIPRTSYRYQVIVTDYNKQSKKTGKILFTTKKE